jgi:hypothetical protein
MRENYGNLWKGTRKGERRRNLPRKSKWKRRLRGARKSKKQTKLPLFERALHLQLIWTEEFWAEMSSAWELELQRLSHQARERVQLEQTVDVGNVPQSNSERIPKIRPEVPKAHYFNEVRAWPLKT